MGYAKVVAFLVIVLLWHSPGGARAQDISNGTGLEVENYSFVCIIIETLPEGATEVGLTKDRVLPRVELRLRQAGLHPGEQRSGECLYVSINVVGQAFSVHLAFLRWVSYVVGENRQLRVHAATWNTGGAGTHGRDSEYIVQGLDRHLDQFVNEYLKANGR